MGDSFVDSGMDNYPNEWWPEPFIVPTDLDPLSADISAPAMEIVSASEPCACELDMGSSESYPSEDSSLSFEFSSPLDLSEDRMVLPNDLSLEVFCHPLYSPLDAENHLNGIQYSVYPGQNQDSYPSDMNLNSSQDQQSTDESSEDCSIEDESKESLVSGTSGGKMRRAKHSWSVEENCLLQSLVEEYRYDWKKISKCMGNGLTSKQCREHFSRMKKPINKSTWSEEEKQILRDYRLGNITEEELYMRLNRSKKQIKERLEIENKNVCPWSDKELDCLIQLMDTYGNAYGKIKGWLKEYGYDRSYQQVRCKVIAIRKKRN